jgi:hypothetical protein
MTRSCVFLRLFVVLLADWLVTAVRSNYMTVPRRTSSSFDSCFSSWLTPSFDIGATPPFPSAQQVVDAISFPLAPLPVTGQKRRTGDLCLFMTSRTTGRTLYDRAACYVLWPEMRLLVTRPLRHKVRSQRRSGATDCRGVKRIISRRKAQIARRIRRGKLCARHEEERQREDVRRRPLDTETVEGSALSLESVNYVEGGDGLALGMLGVGDGVSNDV